MKNSDPLVSVLMTSYNREKYIAEAIESVIESNYKNIELIVVDDVSKDRTVDIAMEYASKDSRVKVFINEKNLGDYPNRNKAVSYAAGDYFIFVDSDDKLNADTIGKILDFVKEDENFNFAMYWPHSNETFMLKGDEALQKHFFEKQFLYMGPGGTFIRREFFNRIGGYPVKYGPANDMYFNLKACCHSSIHLFPFEFIFYRRHEGQEINNKHAYLYHTYNYMKDALEYLKLPFSQEKLEWLKKKNKRRFVHNLFKFILSGFQFAKARDAWKKAEFGFKDLWVAIFQF